MDKRNLALLFRERLRGLIEDQGRGLAAFARETGLDRSALNQLLSDTAPRLPRAETLRRLAETQGVSIDWLLGLSNAPVGKTDMTPSVEIETARHDDGTSPLDRWWQEAQGYKVRYVPAGLPDMMRIPELTVYDVDPKRAGGREAAGEIALDEVRLGTADLEIAMPLQTLEDFARGGSIWTRLSPSVRRRQLLHLAALAERHYPALRLHLYDGQRTFAAPFTVFGATRASLYLGEAYLVLTNAEQVRAMARSFDVLVRRAVIGPDRVHLKIGELAAGVAERP